MMLAIYAVKCGIDEDELRRDADRLMKIFDDMSYEDSNRFTVEDVVKALEMYNENFVTFPRADIAKYSGIPIPPNKRNWRKQTEHIQYMNNQRAFKVSRGECTNGGRPDKYGVIREYMLSHPEIRKKTDIATALRIDRHTVGKYYDEIRAELDCKSRLATHQRHIVVENGKIVIKTVPSQELSDQLLNSVKLS